MNLVLVKGYHICTQSMWGECARECEDGGGGRDRAGARTAVTGHKGADSGAWLTHRTHVLGI